MAREIPGEMPKLMPGEIPGEMTAGRVSLIQASLKMLNDQTSHLESDADNLQKRLSCVLRPDDSGPTLGNAKTHSEPPCPVTLAASLNSVTKRLDIVRIRLEQIFDRLEL